MDQPSPATRRRLVAVAGHEGRPGVARAHLADPDPVVRATAVRALRRLGELAWAELAGALADGDPAVRRAALEVLAGWGDPTGAGPRAGALAALLDDPDPTVVEVAAWACGEQPAADPDEPDDPDLPGDQRAHDLPPALVEQLCRLATGHDDALVREAAVAALGALGDPAALPAVLAATGDRATVRRRAVLALAAFEGPEVDEALERARGDRDRQVRQAAEDLTPGSP